MIRRMLPAASLLSLAACQPHYAYPPYASDNAPLYASSTPSPMIPTGIPVWASPSSSAHTGPQYRTVRLAAAANDVALPTAPAGDTGAASSGTDGAFRDVGLRGGDVAFFDVDPVRKREIATYPDRYVERITLKNNGLFVYEMLTSGSFASVSDAALIKADLDQPSFRERGIIFDAAKLEQVGPFTYLAQSSSTDNCFLFRGKFRHAAAQDGDRLDETAYGNICYPAQSKDLASVKAEMLDLLTHARFGSGADAALVTAAPAAKPQASIASASPISGPVILGRCRSSVSFSGAPTRKPAPSEPLVETAEYGYAQGGYSEKAACTCKRDFDYAQVTQFDAVDNVRRHAAENGFVLQKATFDPTSAQGRALDYEAASERDTGEAFLVGRTFYRQCSLSVAASGVSYADLQRAKKFLASVTTQRGEGTGSSETLVSNATITAAHPEEEASEASSGSTVPPTLPTPPVAIADLPHPTGAKAEEPPANKAGAPAALSNSAASDTAAPAITAAPAAPSDTVVDRLRRLKLLLDQKLITPAEYEAKRKAVIDTL